MKLVFFLGSFFLLASHACAENYQKKWNEATKQYGEIIELQLMDSDIYCYDSPVLVVQSIWKTDTDYENMSYVQKRASDYLRMFCFYAKHRRAQEMLAIETKEYKQKYGSLPKFLDE